MSAKSAIEKLQTTTKEKEAHKKEHKQKRGGSRIVEKNRSRKGVKMSREKVC
jgi:hypothetical protein